MMGYETLDAGESSTDNARCLIIKLMLLTKTQNKEESTTPNMQTKESPKT
jgi:hypothetical protein